MSSGAITRRHWKTTRTETLMTHVGAAHVTDVLVVAIPVTDQDLARDFYVNVLGFEKHEDVVVGEGFRWLELRAAGSSCGVALVAPEPDVPVGVDTGIRLAVLDARAMHAHLNAAGVEVGELLLWEGAPPM